MSETQTSTPIAQILSWRYEYRFAGLAHLDDRVDIDIYLTLRKHDSTAIIAGASLFAAGDTTPAGLVNLGPGDYTVMLPIRGFHAIRWGSAGKSGREKLYFLNLKLTTVPTDEDDEPEFYDRLGVTLGFRTIEVSGTPGSADLALRLNGSPQPVTITDVTEIDATGDLRTELTARRDAGITLLRANADAEGPTHGSSRFATKAGPAGRAANPDQRPGINACFTTPSRRGANAEEDQKEPATAPHRLFGLSLWGRFPVLF